MAPCAREFAELTAIIPSSRGHTRHISTLGIADTGGWVTSMLLNDVLPRGDDVEAV